MKGLPSGCLGLNSYSCYASNKNIRSLTAKTIQTEIILIVLFTDNEHIRRFCHIPKPTTQYPLCGEKIEVKLYQLIIIKKCVACRSSIVIDFIQL